VDIKCILTSPEQIYSQQIINNNFVIIKVVSKKK
jgi:hypothetical protein